MGIEYAFFGPTFKGDGGRRAPYGMGFLVMCCIGSGSLAASVSARAAVVQGESLSSSDTGLAEIVVTARKRTEDVQAIPEVVEVISAAVLDQAHVTRIDDLGNIVSNLNITTRSDHTPDVVLRGVGAFGVTHGVGFYQDDVQLFDGQTVQLEDLERVEVLKGPQGTLYGGSNIGGAIKYVSKLPTDDFEGRLALEKGNYGLQTASGMLSGPVVPGVLDARVSGYFTTGDGYIYDTTLGHTVDHGQEFGGRGILKYQAAETTVLLFLNLDRTHTGAENLYYRPNSPTDYSYELADGTEPLFHRSIYSATLNVQQRLGHGLELTSISSFFESFIDAVTDVDKGPVPFLANYASSRQTVESEELRLGNSAAGPLKWLAGVFVQGNDLPRALSDTRSFNGDPGDMASWSNPALYSDQVVNPQQKHRDYAVFGNVQYALDAWAFEGGLRLDYDDSSMTDPLNHISSAQHATEVMPKVSMSYQLSSTVMTYVTVSRGFEPGDLTEGADAAGNAVIDHYRPETALNYEVGLKSSFDDRIRLNAALFYVDYKNRLFQSNQFESGQFVNVITNIGTSKNYGAETDFTLRLTHDLTLAGSLGVTRAVWGKVPYIDPDLNYAAVNLNGRIGPNTPRYQGSLALDWVHSLTDLVSVGARVDATAIGSQYWDVTDHYSQPAYQLLNAGVRLEVARFELSAHASNLNNARYNTAYISAAEVGAPFNVAGIGRPRLYGVKLTYRF
jgi:iron complex outermembrane receptor protein